MELDLIQSVDPTQFLFSKRLDFLDYSQTLLQKIQGKFQEGKSSFSQALLQKIRQFKSQNEFYQNQELQINKLTTLLPQDMFLEKKLSHEGQFSILIESQQNISLAYKKFNYLIYKCKYGKKIICQGKQKCNVCQKKNFKDLPKKYSAKIQKAYELLNLNLQQLCAKEKQSLKNALSHKNMTVHLIKAKVFLNAILKAHFQPILAKKRAVFKNLKLSPLIKINICILVIDIIGLINMMKTLYCPSNLQKGQFYKEEENYLKLKSEYLIAQNKQINQVIDNLKISDFLKAIQPQFNYKFDHKDKYAIWWRVQTNIQNNFIEQNGIIKTKVEKQKEETTHALLIQKIHDSWKKFLKTNGTKQTIQASKYHPNLLLSAFHDQKQFVSIYLKSLSKQELKKELIQQIASKYLDILKDISLRFEIKCIEDFYLKQILSMFKKGQISIEYIHKNKHSIKAILQKAIKDKSSFWKKQHSSILQSVQKDIHDKFLIGDFILDYFNSIKNKISKITQINSSLNEWIQKHKLNVLGNWQNLQEKDVLERIGKSLQRIPFIKSQDDINQQVNEKNAYSSLLITYQEEQQHVFDEIKYFLIVKNCITEKQFDRKQLEHANQYYQGKRRKFFSDDTLKKSYHIRLGQQNLNNLNLDLLDLVKNLTFELILKIRLNQLSSHDFDRMMQIIYKMAVLYYKKLFQKQEQQQLQSQKEQNIRQNEEIFTQLSRRRSTVELELQNCKFSEFMIQNNEQSLKCQTLGIKFAKKIFELRLQMIKLSLQALEKNNNVFKTQYIEIKTIIYQTAFKATNINCDPIQINENANSMAKIQYLFLQRKFYEAWTLLLEFKQIQKVMRMLEFSWSGTGDMLKKYVIVYLKYQQAFSGQSTENRIVKVLEQMQIYSITQAAIQRIGNEKKRQQLETLKSNLHQSLKILDILVKLELFKNKISIENVNKRRTQQNELNRQQEFKNSQIQTLKFCQIGKLKNTLTIFKNQQKSIKIFQLTLKPEQYDNLSSKFKKLTQLNLHPIHFQKKLDKDFKLQMKYQQKYIQFDSYPMLIKYLIETYYKIIVFCRNKLNFQFYPLLSQEHFEIKEKNKKFHLKINPYEGIFLVMLLSHQQIKNSQVYNYPKYPFIYFSNQLKNKFINLKIYQKQKSQRSCEQHGFWHLIDQMKALSMDMESNKLQQLVSKILKFPYFWSLTDKFYEIVQFKQKYHKFVGKQEGRRKQNQKFKRGLHPSRVQQFEPKSITYKDDYKQKKQYHKTVQLYLTIQGLIEKQAYLENIGNFRTTEGEDQYNRISPKSYLLKYEWSLQQNGQLKEEINKLITLMARKQVLKNNSNRNISNNLNQQQIAYRRRFPSFHFHIRNLRNILVHYISQNVDEVERQVTVQQKISIIEQSFPKILVFIYRWKPYLFKNFYDIKTQRKDLLLDLVKSEASIEKLNKIPAFRPYNKEFNGKHKLLKYFKYNSKKDYSVEQCQICFQLFLNLKKKQSLWDLLFDHGTQMSTKKQPYNWLFWQHSNFICDGIKNLSQAYFNTIARTKFTPEQIAEVQLKQVDDQEMGDDNQFNNRKFEELQSCQLSKIHKDILKYDYVSKFFMYQFEMKLPYLFFDLRNQRYQWDKRANEHW